MARLFLYLGVMALGVFLGSRKWMRSRTFPWIGKVQAVVLILLIFILGANVGSDQRVFDSLGTIGLSAAVITICTVVGSLLCVTLLRRLMGLGKDGRTKQQEDKP